MADEQVRNQTIDNNEANDVNQVVDNNQIYEIAKADPAAVNEQLTTIDQLSVDQIGNYGSDAQDKISGYANNIMQNVQTRDVGEVGDQLTQLSVALKQTDEKQGGFLSRIFKRTKETAMTKATLYNSVNNVVNGIENTLNTQISDLDESNQNLTKFSENIRDYLKDLDVRVTAVSEKIKQIQEHDLPEAKQAKEAHNTVEADQKIADLEDELSAWQDRSIDLQESYQVANAELMQIRISQQTNRALIAKIKKNKQNVLPLWRMMSVSQIAQLQQKEMAEKNEELKEATEKMLTSGAQLTHDNAVAIAKMNNQATVSVESIKQFKDTLNATIDDLISANQDVEAQRQKTLDELNNMKAGDHQ